IREGWAEFREFEPETLVERGGGQNAFALQQLSREAAQESSQDESGNVEERRPMHRLREEAGEIRIANRPGSGAIQRTVDIEILRGKKKELADVLEMDPRHPLPAAAEASSQPEAERNGHQRKGAA